MGEYVWYNEQDIYQYYGDDTWDSSYKDSVIDDNPASSTGTPFPYSFDVQWNIYNKNSLEIE